MEEGDWMKNWIDVATWRQDQREKQQEENKMREGVQNFRDSGYLNRDFFNVDKRDEIRQAQKRMKEEEKAKEMEEREQRRLEEKRRQEEDEERRRKEKEDKEEESQSLLAIAKREEITGHIMRRENAIGFPCKLKKERRQ